MRSRTVQPAWRVLRASMAKRRLVPSAVWGGVQAMYIVDEPGRGVASIGTHRHTVVPGKPHDHVQGPGPRAANQRA